MSKVKIVTVCVGVRMYAPCSGNKCHEGVSFIDGENAKGVECFNCLRIYLATWHPLTLGGMMS